MITHIVSFQDFCQTLSNVLQATPLGQVCAIPLCGLNALQVKRIACISQAQIDIFCAQQQVSLPDDYLYFLKTVGIIEINSGDTANSHYVSSILGVSPIDYIENTRFIFDGYGDNPFPDFLLTHHTTSGAFAGLVIGENGFYTHYGICYAEIPPEYWAQDYDGAYTSFSEWFMSEVIGMAEIESPDTL